MTDLDRLHQLVPTERNLVTDYPPIDTIRHGPEGNCRITGHYWVDNRRWIEAVWTEGTTHTHRRELIDYDTFIARFPDTVQPE